jgi:hypothetical protein
MAGGHIMFAGLVAFTQYGVNSVQTATAIFRLRNRSWLELHLRALRKFDCF